MKSYIISEELGQAILTYLGTQPYADVFKLINALQQMTPIEGNGALTAPKPVEQPGAATAQPQKEEAKN